MYNVNKNLYSFLYFDMRQNCGKNGNKVTDIINRKFNRIELIHLVYEE